KQRYIGDIIKIEKGIPNIFKSIPGYSNLGYEFTSEDTTKAVTVYSKRYSSLWVKVDAEDYERVNQYKWYLQVNGVKRTGGFILYAVCSPSVAKKIGHR